MELEIFFVMGVLNVQADTFTIVMDSDLKKDTDIITHIYFHYYYVEY